MRGVLRAFAFLTVVAGVLAGGVVTHAGGVPPGRAGGGKVIKIGFAGPLSGDQAYFGRTWLNGVKMAAEHFVFSGGLAGATVKLIALDDAADPARGVADARAHVRQGVVGVVANFNSGVTLATEPTYHRAGIPQITVSSAPAVTSRGYKNVVQFDLSNSDEGSQMAVFARKRLHLKSVAVFNDSLAFGLDVSTHFVASARKLGITVVGGNMRLNPNARDYSSPLATALARHPQAIYFGGTVTPGSLLCRQARARGFTGPFLGADGLFTSAFITGCGPRIGTAYVTAGVPPYNSSPALRSFSRAYKQQFGSPPGPYSAYGYDNMDFLLTAINLAGKASSHATVSKLRAFTYHGVLGLERINAKGELVNAPNYVYKVEGGTFVAVYSSRSG